MLFMGSKLQVVDNSGAFVVKIITGNRVWKIGSMLSVSIQSCKLQKKLQVGEVMKGLIVQTRNAFKRGDGSAIFARNNTVVLFKRGELVGTRVKVVVPIELRFFGHLKIVLISEGTL
jgi:ribosomal protein L14